MTICAHKKPDKFTIADVYEEGRYFHKKYCLECGEITLFPMQTDRFTRDFLDNLKQVREIIYFDRNDSGTLAYLMKLRDDSLKKV